MGAEVHKISGELILKNGEMHLVEGMSIMGTNAAPDRWGPEIEST